MMLDRGLVLMSDTRTNSGVDNISTFRKMFHWSLPGERIVALMTAGNLATTQAVVSKLEERNKAPAERHNTVLEAPTMFQVATIVGKLLRETIQERNADNGMKSASSTFTASMILAGQIKGMEPRIFLIYPEGNFIEAQAEYSGRYLSEDYAFCRRLRAAGMRVWLCPWMAPTHTGSHTFTGSLIDLAALRPA